MMKASVPEMLALTYKDVPFLPAMWRTLPYFNFHAIFASVIYLKEKKERGRACIEREREGRNPDYYIWREEMNEI